MKALILCAGAATRLQPLTHTWAKAAIPVANRPVLVRVAEYLARFGIRSLGVVVAPGQPSLRALEPALTELEVDVTWLEEALPLGIVHALRSARDFLGDEPFLHHERPDGAGPRDAGLVAGHGQPPGAAGGEPKAA